MEKRSPLKRASVKIMVTKNQILQKIAQKNALSTLFLDIFSSFKNKARHVFFENQYKVCILVSWCAISSKLHR
jgi:hypothetical protein